MALSQVELATAGGIESTAKSFSDIAKQTAKELNRVHGAITCSIFIFSTDRNHLFSVCRVRSDSTLDAAYELDRDQHPVLFNHFDRHSVLTASAARLHPVTSNFNQGFFIPEGVHSVLAVALRQGEQVKGVVALEYDSPTQWEPRQVEAVQRDATELATQLRYRSQLDFDTRHQLLRYGVETCSLRMLAIDATTENLIYANQAFLKVEKLPLEALIGRNADVSKMMAPFTQHGRRLFEQVKQRGSVEGEAEFLDRDGAKQWFRYRMSMVNANNAPFILVESEDTTPQRCQQNELENLAWNCQLTGVFNRSRFIEQVDQFELLILVDVNGFRRFNDMNGEAIGDAVLQEIAQRLKQSGSLFSTDSIFRLGADEFVIGFLKRPVFTFEAIAAELRQRLQSEIVIEDQPYRLQVTVSGLDQAILSPQISPLAALDMAAYEARKGRFFQFYDDQLQRDLLQQAQLEQELKSAVTEDQLVLHYQPLICAKQQRITGAEALIRWQHPEQGLLFPGSFIDIAERSSLIESVGRWVLESALYQLYLWQRIWPELTMHVNVSVKQLLSEEFFELCWDQLNQYQVKPGSFVLEITENTLMEDVESVGKLCEQLGELGLVLAIDDFGTGYSSMSYLKQLPVQKLKIDRSFIADLEHSKESRQIVPAIIVMGRALNVAITAEGVENQFQEQFLRAHSCNEMQGYYYSKPIPKLGFEQKLRDSDIIA